MAEAKAVCTCTTCGKVFVRTAEKADEKAAREWEKWAIVNLRECPECWQKRCDQHNDQSMLKAFCRVSPSPSPSVWIVIEGPTFTYKDVLRESGYKWSSYYPQGDDALSAINQDKSQKRWSKNFTVTAGTLDTVFEKIQNELEHLEKIGFCTVCEILQSDIDKLEHMCSMIEDYKKEHEAQDSIMPKRPSWMQDGNWNGCIYGKIEKHIYINGKKYLINSDEEKELKSYRAALKYWRTRLKNQ